MKNSIIKLGFLFCFVILSQNIYSQKRNTFQEKSKEELKTPYLFFGGSLWLGFGTYTFVDVNAIFGTQVTKRLAIGLSGKYMYNNDKRSISGNFETSVYGGSVYSQFAIIENFGNLFKTKGHSGIIAHAEYEMLNTKYNYIYFNSTDTNRERYWLHNVLIGGGYFQNFSEGAKSYIVLLWNVSQADNNPFTYPQLRVGFTFAF